MTEAWTPPPDDEPVISIAWDGVSDHDAAGLREEGPVPEGPVVAVIDDNISLADVARMVARISTVYPDQLMTGLELLAAKINALGRNQEALARRFDGMAAKLEAYERVLPDPETLAGRVMGRVARRRMVPVAPTAPARPGPVPPPAPAAPLGARPPARAIPHTEMIPDGHPPQAG